MKRCSILLPAVVGLLTACAPEMSQQDMGTLVGGVVGGVLGHQIGGGSGRALATMGGALAGSMVGSHWGQVMDDVNRMKMAQVLTDTPEDHTRSWIDRRNGHRFSVRPMKSWEQQGQLCRQYRASVLIEGRLQTATGVACQDHQGQWRLMS